VRLIAGSSSSSSAGSIAAIHAVHPRQYNCVICRLMLFQGLCIFAWCIFLLHAVCLCTVCDNFIVLPLPLPLPPSFLLLLLLLLLLPGR
jgi:hypothetical protein